MQNAKDFSPAAHGLTITIIGPPGSGKSHFARSAVQHYAGDGTGPAKSFALLAPSAELASYAGLNMDYEILADENFDVMGFLQTADRSKLSAKAYNLLRDTLTKLEASSQYKLTIFDTMSKGVDRAVWNSIMAGEGAVLTQAVNNPFGPYVKYSMAMEQIVNRLDLLRYRKQMHLIMLWHSDMKELEGHGKMRTELNDKGKREVRWDAAMQPEAHGRAFPPQVLAWSDLAFYGEPVVTAGKDGKKDFRCRLVAVPDEVRLPKTRLPGVMKRLAEMSEIPNDFPALLKVVEECYKAGGGR